MCIRDRFLEVPYTMKSRLDNFSAIDLPSPDEAPVINTTFDIIYLNILNLIYETAIIDFKFFSNIYSIRINNSSFFRFNPKYI